MYASSNEIHIVKNSPSIKKGATPYKKILNLNIKLKVNPLTALRKLLYLTKNPFTTIRCRIYQIYLFFLLNTE